MRILFKLIGVFSVALIFWAALGYLMSLPSFPFMLPLSIVCITLFFAVGLLKNHIEKKKFMAFLEEKESDKDLQKRLKNERVDPGDKTGRAKIKSHFRERNVGLTWMAASVHGAVPKRNKRRSFLPKSR